MLVAVTRINDPAKILQKILGLVVIRSSVRRRLDANLMDMMDAVSGEMLHHIAHHGHRTVSNLEAI